MLRAIIVGALPGLLSAAGAADSLLWDQERQRVDANIQSWDVVQVLQRVAASSHWQIYLQPDTKQVVSTRFRNLPVGEALRRLLGDLSFVEAPQSNAPPRLYVFRGTREDATQLIRAAELAAAAQAKRIEDELVVKLKAGEKADDLAKRLGAKVTGRLDNLNAYRLKFASADEARRALQSLAGEASVAAVDFNYSIPLPESLASVPQAAPPVDLQPKSPPDGKYIIVGLIDSAVQPKAGGFGGFILDPLSVVGDTRAPADQPTHGTAMSETILHGLDAVLKDSAATAVRILPVDVYGDNPTTSSFDVALGITKAVNAGAKIINLSLGSPGDSTVLHDVIRSSHDQGVIFFAAAGNEPVTTPVLPAAWPETTAVTAVDRSGNIASYANRGDFVRAGGPGTVPIAFNDVAYIVSGTSASTAFVSGVAAGVAESTGRSLRDIERNMPRLMPVKKP
jgi:hypothetical protein